MKDSNEALELSLVLPGATGPKTVAKFHPGFTYSIFGDADKIFGYQDLKISLAYNATDMRPNLAISYSKKFKPVGETEALDIHEVLKQFLPEGLPFFPSHRKQTKYSNSSQSHSRRRPSSTRLWPASL